MGLLTPDDIPTIEPEIVYAGQTIKWTRSFSDYPSDEYTLKYYLSGPASVTLIGAQYGTTTDHLISVTSATSAAYVFGIYQWQAYAEKGAGATLEKYFISSGFLTIKTTAGKSHAKTMLDKYETAIEALTLNGASSFSVAGKTYTSRDLAELRRERNMYRDEYQAECDKERMSFGRSASNRLYTRL